MPTITRKLSPEFMKKFGIKNVFRQHDGAQKDVYIVEYNGKKCALKIFKQYNKRDIRELEIYKQYRHIKLLPKTISVTKNGKDVIVFEKFIDGDNLEEVSARYKNNSKSVANIVKTIVNTIEPIWNDGIIHRDIKPSNIIIMPDGTPVLIDYGIAGNLKGTSYTDTGFQPHSWRYAAPEQHAGMKKLISYRTDFFSLAIVAYYLYYGKHPFGNTKTKIHNLFIDKENKLKDDKIYQFDPDCPFNKFFDSVFLINPASRPRNAKLFVELLKSI